ncbi:hypothetical protein [Nesterenkonia sandarakina]|uniref:Uncharacterized protein n=2 Tax=Nesterenkonia sandarakina TaxID=272918 RepID=A0A7Z0J1W0_9MICC|nr:hypothetical protein [Nesterenkonia sandarakina]
MEVVRREFARGPSVELTTPAGHTYAMLLAALRAEVRAVVDAELGVQARRVHVLELDQDTMTIDLRLSVTMSSHSSISDLQVRLRAGITVRLREAAGLRTRTLDLIAEDIYDE